MNILIYIPRLENDWGGVKQYTNTLLNVLHEDFKNHYYVYNDVNDEVINESIKKIPIHTVVTTQEINRLNNKIKNSGIRFANLLLRLVQSKKRIEYLDNFSLYCEKLLIQIIHCPYQFIPQTKSAKLITTLHDVQELHFPEFFSAEIRAYRGKMYLDYLSRADSVIVSYNHVKNDLIKYFQIPAEKIKTVLLQMSKLWVYKYTEDDLVELPQKLETQSFILYPANAWKHKNHLNLLEAIAYLRDKENILIRLVCTGDFDSENGKAVLSKTNELKLKNQVIFLGMVNEKMLYSLYRKTLAVVIPTLYEAGSFPLMESFFLDVPVVCSNVTSLPETMGNSLFTFDPTDITSIASSIKQILYDEDFRKKSLENSKIQKEKLTRINSLDLLISNYKTLVK